MDDDEYKYEEEYVQEKNFSQIDNLKDPNNEQIITENLTQMLPSLEELDFSKNIAEIETIFHLILEITEDNSNFNFFSLLSPNLYNILFDFVGNEDRNAIVALGSSFLLRSIGRDMNEKQILDFYDGYKDLLVDFIPHVINESNNAIIISNVLSLGIELQHRIDISLSFDNTAIICYLQRFGGDFTEETENIHILLQRSFLFITYYIKHNTLTDEFTKTMLDTISENLYPLLADLDFPGIRATFIELIRTLISRNVIEDQSENDNEPINCFDWVYFFEKTPIVEKLFLKWIENYKDFYSIYIICDLIRQPHFPINIDSSFFFKLLESSESSELTEKILSNELAFLKEDFIFLNSFISNNYPALLLEKAENYDFNNKKQIVLIFSQILSKVPDLIEQDLLKSILSFSLDCFSFDEKLDRALFKMLLSLIERNEFQDLVLDELFSSYTNIIDAINDYDEFDEEKTQSIAQDLKTLIDQITEEKNEEEPK